MPLGTHAKLEFLRGRDTCLVLYHLIRPTTTELHGFESHPAEAAHFFFEKKKREPSQLVVLCCLALFDESQIHFM